MGNEAANNRANALTVSVLSSPSNVKGKVPLREIEQ